MRRRGLGKQRPYVRSGKLGERGAEAEKADLRFLGHSCKPAWTFTPLGAEGVGQGWQMLVSAPQASPQLEASIAQSLLCSGVGQPGDSYPGTARR